MNTYDEDDEEKESARTKLSQRFQFGGISGEGDTPDIIMGVKAKLSGELIIFDADRYDYSASYDLHDNLSSYTIETEDGRKCYFEVDQDKNLYALICSGLNVEIWEGVLTVGGPSPNDEKPEPELPPRRRRRAG
jgi:hypothetical protein